MASLVNVITSMSAWDSVLSSKKDKLIVVDFSATWCGPCKAIAPVYDALSTQYRGVTFCKVDVDQSQDISSRYAVTAMPTFLFIKNGQVLETVKGANKSAIESALKKHSDGSSSSGGSAFPGSGHSLSGAKPVPDPKSKSAPNYRMVFILLSLILVVAAKRAYNKSVGEL